MKIKIDPITTPVHLIGDDQQTPRRYSLPLKEVITVPDTDKPARHYRLHRVILSGAGLSCVFECYIQEGHDPMSRPVREEIRRRITSELNDAL